MKSVRGTRWFTMALLVLSICLSLAGVPLARKALAGVHHPTVAAALQLPLFLVLGYGCAGALIGMLVIMLGFLKRLERKQVFTQENLVSLRRICLCCRIGMVLTLALGLLFNRWVLGIAVAAGFMSLIVEVVREAFQKAFEMKQELDLTI